MEFETATDRENEERISRALELRWRCSIGRMNDMAFIDRYVHRGDEVIGFLEIKARNYQSNSFDAMYLSLRKYIALKQAADHTGLPAVFAWGFKDRILYIDISKVPSRRPIVAGRHDRGVTNDIEPILLVPTKLMTPVEYPT